MRIFVFALLLIGTTFAQSPNVIPILKQDQEVNFDGTYHYSYETGNGIAVQEQGIVKNAGQPGQEIEEATGQFQYTAPENIPIQLSYIANEYGFQPQGVHLPTPPPLPEIIRKSLEWIKAHPNGEAEADARELLRQQRDRERQQLDRQQYLELQRQEDEKERLRNAEVERQRQLQDAQRQQLELEREQRERQKNEEIERQRQLQEQLNLQVRFQQEERQKAEAERQRQLQDAERQRQLQEAERQRQLQLQQEAERQRQLQEAERQRQLQLQQEAERQRQLQEVERQRQLQLQQEAERQRQLQLQKQEAEKQRQLQLQKEEEEKRRDPLRSTNVIVNPIYETRKVLVGYEKQYHTLEDGKTVDVRKEFEKVPEKIAEPAVQQS